MKKSIACIIYNQLEHKIFIAKRIPVGEMGSKWEFPGGKIENNEDESRPLLEKCKKNLM